jgi:uncharacterized protein (TIGR03435 family)
LAFDVVSVRQNVTPMNPQMGPPQFGPTADGYRMANMPLFLPLLTAYVPTVGGAAFFTQDHITGIPDWMMNARFDIQAKVSDEDLPEWQKPAEQPAMLRAMLQAFFADRCKLVVHREVKELAVYSMVVGKGGPKFKPTNPDEVHEGMKLPFGGIVSQPRGNNTVTLYAAPMKSLATLLSSIGRTSRPIQDQTGLTGLYDVVLTLPDMPPPSPVAPGGTSASDPGGSFVSTIVESLGLKLESTKAPVETLVIDHMERPSEN